MRNRIAAFERKPHGVSSDEGLCVRQAAAAVRAEWSTLAARNRQAMARLLRQRLTLTAATATK
jgi:hypothetical protein